MTGVTGMPTPLWSPPLGPLPFLMVLAEMLLVKFEADPTELHRTTPEPLE